LNQTTLNGNPGTAGKVVVTYDLALPPTITAVSPISGELAGGESVIVSGTNFINGGTTVTFGANVASCVFNSTIQLTCTAPAAVNAGEVDVRVTTGGGSDVLPGGYTYLPPAPIIISISPSTGLTTGNEHVTITGTNFDNLVSVTFGGEAASCTVVSVGVTLD
jgi:hypothetical protein